MNIKKIESYFQKESSTEKRKTYILQGIESRSLDEQLEFLEEVARWFNKQYEHDGHLVIIDLLIQVLGDGDTNKLAQYYNSQGLVQRRAGKYEEAMASYVRSRQLFLDIGDGQRHADVECNMGVLLMMNMGRAREALEYIGRSLSFNLQKGEGNEKDVALDTNNLGIAYAMCGELDKSAEKYKEALSIYEKIGKHDSIMRTHINLGNLYIRMGDYTQSIQCLNKGLSVVNDDDYLNLGKIHNGLGLCHHAFGQFRKSINHYKEAMNDYARANYLPGCMKSLGNLGSLYENIGDIQHAEECYQAQYQLLQQAPDAHGSVGNAINLSMILAKKGEFDQAERFMEDIRDKAYFNDDYVRISIVLNLAIIKKMRGADDEALQLMESIEDLCKVSGGDSNLLALLHNKANIHYAKGDTESSVLHHKEALELARQTGELLWASKTLNALAYDYIQLEQFDEAYDFAQECYDLSDEMRTSLYSSKNRISFGEEMEKNHRLLVLLSYELGKKKECFEQLEKAKSNSLLYLLSQLELSLPLGTNAMEWIEKEKDLLRFFRGLQLEETNDDSIGMDEIIEKEKELSIIQDEIGKRFPEYMELRTTHSVRFGELKKILND